MDRLRKRADFLRTAGGAKWATPGFVLQARRRFSDHAPPRTGFTASRKVGIAVARNRARRRLKEAARLTLPARARPGHDYVLIARRGTLTRPFDAMLDDLAHALHMVHERLDARGREPDERRSGKTRPSSGAS